MKTLRVLHVASFKGNIGDNANHRGFRSSLAKNLDIELDYTEYEIRDVFRKIKKFDTEFVNYANTFDLLVVGGGNYFELWVESSQTGTSIDISLENLRNLKVLTLFNALGVDPAQGANSTAVSKFRKFLDVVISSDNMLLSCRNDGSMDALNTIVGADYAKHFVHLPDAGFFTQVTERNYPELNANKCNIVIQLAGDMLETRFPDGIQSSLSYSTFLEEFKLYCESIFSQNVQFVFVPHIFRDYKIIYDILNVLPDHIVREATSVAPYLLGDDGQDYIFGLYSKSDVVLGMRFHANICAMGLNVPCIGLVNYRQISELYREMDFEHMKVDVRKLGFSKELNDLTLKALQLKSKWYPDDFLTVWKSKISDFHVKLNGWIKEKI